MGITNTPWFRNLAAKEEATPPWSLADEAIDAVDAVTAALDNVPPLSAWQKFDQKARREESAYQAAAIALFAKERESVANRLLNAPPPGVKADDPRPAIANPFVEFALLRIAADYAPGGAYHQAWLARYQQLISTTMRMGGRDVSSRVGISFNPTTRARAMLFSVESTS
jgi:hypothetical protein